MKRNTVAVAPPVERTNEGQFPQGVSGNPLGRPKGSKNKITLLRQSLELQLREQAAPEISGVLEKAIELALDGDRQMIKLLVEMHLTKSPPEQKEIKEKVEININAESPQIQPTIIEHNEDIQDGEIAE